jgi:hypothetical protein
MNEGASGGASSTDPVRLALSSGTSSAATSAPPSTTTSTVGLAIAVKTKDKPKIKKPATVVLASIVPEENIVDVFENEGEYQGNSGDEEIDNEHLPDADQVDSDDESYHGGSEEDMESE